MRNETIISAIIQLLPQIAAACETDHVALIDKDSVQLIGCELKKIGCKRLLEIGSGYGYSALSFLVFLLEEAGGEKVAITTIERLQSRWERTTDYITGAGAADFICCILGEAPEAFSYLDNKKWDCIFMDAAMGRYGDFWLQLKDLLSPDGIFIADNINLHGVLDKPTDALPRRHRTMAKRLKEFLQMLECDEVWQYERYDYGEGLLVIRRRDSEKQ